MKTLQTTEERLRTMDERSKIIKQIETFTGLRVFSNSSMWKKSLGKRFSVIIFRGYTDGMESKTLNGLYPYEIFVCFAEHALGQDGNSIANKYSNIYFINTEPIEVESPYRNSKKLYMAQGKNPTRVNNATNKVIETIYYWLEAYKES